MMGLLKRQSSRFEAYWTTLSGMYPGVEIYTEQLRALESYCGTSPNSAGGAFMLGYHYLTGGHSDAA
jgi:hypothetical protein